MKKSGENARWTITNLWARFRWVNAENIEAGRLNFTTDHLTAFKEAQVIYIAVGTPENEDGTANLTYVNQVIEQIAQNVKRDIIVVTKVQYL